MVRGFFAFFVLIFGDGSLSFKRLILSSLLGEHRLPSIGMKRTRAASMASKGSMASMLDPKGGAIGSQEGWDVENRCRMVAGMRMSAGIDEWASWRRGRRGIGWR